MFDGARQFEGGPATQEEQKMKAKNILSTAALALLAGASTAYAQHPREAPDHGRAAVTFSHEHGAMLREHAASHRYRSHHDPHAQLQIGATLPHSVQLHDLPDAFRSRYPHAHSYRYGIVNDRHVIVDPSSRRIVYVY